MFSTATKNRRTFVASQGTKLNGLRFDTLPKLGIERKGPEIRGAGTNHVVTDLPDVSSPLPSPWGLGLSHKLATPPRNNSSGES